MYSITPYTDQAVKDICHHCGSAVAKKSYNYFRRMNYVTGGKVWSKVWSKDGVPVAFYYASKCRDHIRLIEIAVKEEYKRKGLGKTMLFDLLSLMKHQGLHKLTFRTPIVEDAQGFWLHMGARIVDVKGEDYEMELTIK
ncbi:MAG: GNAT family N-acetyltransferase [Bacteroides sp.]|nr:GNAT family N-acetyltransferase [Bacteroides sp.]